jgi:hypothetical protein
MTNIVNTVADFNQLGISQFLNLTLPNNRIKGLAIKAIIAAAKK